MTTTLTFGNNIDFLSLSDNTLFDLYYNQNQPVLIDLARQEMTRRNIEPISDEIEKTEQEQMYPCEY
jgi:hypothetical protein